MKKMIIFFVLLAFGSRAFAQSADLTVVNNNQVCTLFVDMYAYDANLSNYNCDLRTYSIILPPLNSYGPFNPSSVYISPSFVTMVSPFTPAMLAADLSSMSPGWVWTDAEFQYNCPSYDCGTGGRVSENFPAACPYGCLSSSSTTWYYSGFCSPIIKAIWQSPGNCLMNDVTLNFY